MDIGSLVVGLLGIVITGVAVILIIRRLRTPLESAFEGDPVRGTAQVLSLKGIHGWSREDYRREQIAMAYCEMVLRLQLPGQDPYEVTKFPHVKVDAMADLPGKTFVVEVDSANPRNVRIIARGLRSDR